MNKYVIPIDKEEIPYAFDVQLYGQIYTLTINYNERFDFFTMDVARNGEQLYFGIKLVYGNPIFNFTDDPRLAIKITPTDDGGNQTRAGYEQLEETVYLFIEDDGA